MKTEQCNGCGFETNYPESYDDIIYCVHCGKELFPCQNCDNWHDWSNDSCDYEEEQNGCSRFKHRNYKTRKVVLSAKRADHWVQCVYEIKDDSTLIKETWLIHGDYIRRIYLPKFCEHIAKHGFATNKNGGVK